LGAAKGDKIAIIKSLFADMAHRPMINVGIYG
jgi:hypothetical protein